MATCDLQPFVKKNMYVIPVLSVFLLNSIHDKLVKKSFVQ